MMSDYWNEHGDPVHQFVDGFMSTGDLARVDDKKNLFYLGRIKDIIIRGGVNISPKEIEDVISKLPQVQQVAVVGLPHELYGEKIVAVVQAYSDTTVSCESLKAFCAQQLAQMKRPQEIYLWPQIPLNVSGKIDKRSIREQLLAWEQKAVLT